jgi:hypothetical protein
MPHKVIKPTIPKLEELARLSFNAISYIDMVERGDLHSQWAMTEAKDKLRAWLKENVEIVPES